MCATYLWGPAAAVAASAGAGGMGSPVAVLGAIGASCRRCVGWIRFSFFLSDYALG